MINPISINRIAKQYCETAGEIITGDRATIHGDARISFERTARLWSEYLGTPITGKQIPVMMVLLKIARSKAGNFNKDDFIDMCGYSALAGELATEQREDAGVEIDE